MLVLHERDRLPVVVLNHQEVNVNRWTVPTPKPVPLAEPLVPPPGALCRYLRCHRSPLPAFRLPAPPCLVLCRRRRTAGAEDEEITRLRTELRQHPCHGCSDREQHARWAERYRNGLAAHGAVDAPTAADRVAVAATAMQSWRDRRIAFAGFVEMTPQARRVADELAGAGAEVSDVATIGAGEAEARRAIEGTARVGYDLIEIPRLDPDAIDVGMTRRLLEEYGLAGTLSLGLSPDMDISGADPEAAARGEAELMKVVAIARDVGASHITGILYSGFTKYNRPATQAGLEQSVAILRRVCEAALPSNITLGMEVVNRYETNILNTAAHVKGEAFESRRILLAADGLGYSLHDTICKEGSEQLLHYKNHVETNYVIEGHGAVTNVANGQEYPLGPGTVYVLDRHEPHLLRADTDLRIICVFTPALAGQEKHDASGSYPA